jgi:GAF domain-containing protein
VTLPLAHHAAVAALPVFGPALIVLLVVAVHYLRTRGEWDDEELEQEPAADG